MGYSSVIYVHRACDTPGKRLCSAWVLAYVQLLAAWFLVALVLCMWVLAGAVHHCCFPALLAVVCVCIVCCDAVCCVLWAGTGRDRKGSCRVLSTHK